MQLEEEIVMEILKLKPVIKDYLWGGRKLIQSYYKESSLEKVAETWELSTHKDGSSMIVNGKYMNVPFRTYFEIEGNRVLGEKGQRYQEFPILIKFIDAKEMLSIQVHPDDEYALKYEGEFGKNEFWYVLEAEPKAMLYCGVKEQMTKAQMRTSIEEGTICNYLNSIEVEAGDCFFIPAGTIHAIGAGVVIAEIQQSSNSTYRVYDFNRIGADGQVRDLHIDKAVDVANLIPSNQIGKAVGNIINHETYETTLLVDSAYFRCVKYDIHQSIQQNATKESFHAITVIDGKGVLFSDKERFGMQKGDSFFIPACYGHYVIEGNVRVIVTTL